MERHTYIYVYIIQHCIYDLHLAQFSLLLRFFVLLHFSQSQWLTLFQCMHLPNLCNHFAFPDFWMIARLSNYKEGLNIIDHTLRAVFNKDFFQEKFPEIKAWGQKVILLINDWKFLSYVVTFFFSIPNYLGCKWISLWSPETYFLKWHRK